MSIKALTRLLFVSVFGLLVFISPVNVVRAASCVSNGTGGGNFNVPATWTSCGGVAPVAADTITILSGDTVTLVATTTVAGITINSGGILAANTRTLTDSGNYVNNGSHTGTTSAMTLSGSSTIMDGTGSYTPTGVVTISVGDKTILAASHLSFPSVTVTAVTVINNSTAGFSATTALSGTGSFAQGAGSILNIGGTSAITALSASASPNEVHYTSTAANQTIKAPTSAYHHLFIDKSGRVGTLAAATTINGNLSVTAGTLADGGFQISGNATGTLSLAAGSTLTVGALGVGSGTSFPSAYTAGNISLNSTSTVNYNSNSAQTISNLPTYGNLTTTATAAVTKTAAGPISVNGTFTNGANNTFADGGFTLTLHDGGDMDGTHSGTGKILFAGGPGSHSVSGTGSYNNVELDDVNGATQSGTSNIGGTFTITSGTWTVDTNTIVVTGDTSISGTLAINSTTGTKTFGNITVNNGGALSFSAAEAMAINGNLTVNGTGVISGTSGVWTFQRIGGGSISGTTPGLTILGSTTFATPYSILVPFTVNTFTVNTGINETNTGTITINTALSGAGTFTQGSGSILNLGGTSGISAIDAAIPSNEVHYTSTAANQTVKAANYYNLFIEKSTRSANASGTTSVLGNLVVTSGTLSMGASVFSVTGTTSISGTLQDVNNSGSATFNGLVTVSPGGIWTGNPGEACDFNFNNGFTFNGASFDTGGGIYTFQTNNQSISGSSLMTLENMVVSGIQLTNSLAANLTVSNSLSGTGEFIQGTDSTLIIGGSSAIATLTATASGNSVFYNGSSPQTVKATTYRTLDVGENTSGSVILDGDTTSNTALALDAAVVTTGPNKMIIGPGAALTRSTGFINGNLQKNIPTGSPLRTFEIGSGIAYTPVDLSFASVTSAGNIVASTTATDHPSILGSHLLAGKTANRYYSMANTGVVFASYGANFTFVPADVDVGAIPANFVVAKFDTGTWSRPTLGTVTPTSVSVTGVTSMSDFQIGEPDIVAVTLVNTTHANGTFGVGENIDFTVKFNDIVVVAGGTPSLALNSGGAATYLSGSGTDTLTFRYIVLTGDISPDLDYTTISALSLNGATIKDSGGGNANTTLPAVGTFAAAHAIVIDAAPPVFTLVTPTTGSTITNVTTSSGINYTLNKPVTSASITITRTGGTADPGSPHVCTLSGTALSSGSHTINISDTVNGCNPAISVVLGSIYTFAFDATDSAGNFATTVTSTGVLFDVAPSITLVSTAHADGTFSTGEVIDLTVQYTFPVTVAGGTPSLALNSGGAATYLSGSGTDTLTFRYTVLAGQNSSDLSYSTISSLLLSGATIKGAGGTNADNLLPSVATFTGAHAIVIDTTPPVFTLVTPISGSSLNSVTTLSGISYTLSKAAATAMITITRTGGTADPGSPHVCTLSGTALSSGSHTINISDTVNGCNPAISVVNHSTYTFAFDATDTAGNSAVTVSSTGVTFDIISVVASVTTTHADGTFVAGEVIDFMVTYTDPVTVASGSPFVVLNSGGSATYLSGSGTNTLIFRYTVLAGENSPDLAYTTVTALSLNGATIKDSGGGNADNILPSVPSFAGAHSIIIDTTPPATLHIIKVVVNANGGTAVASDFTLHVTSAGVDVAGSPAAGTGSPGTLYTLHTSSYLVSENLNASYTSSISGDCDSSGNITLIAGGDHTCTITNTDMPLAPTPAPAPAGGGGGGGGGAPILPVIGILNVPSPSVLATAGLVTYNYTVWNVSGQPPLIGVTVTDDKCSPAIFVSGDLNNNNQIDQGENWLYRCTTTVTGTTTNIATAQGVGSGFTAVARASATVTTASVPGLPNTGSIGFPNTGSTSTPAPVQVSLSIGSRGADVVALQSILVQKGFLKMPVGVAKGYFGTLTRTALIKYQTGVGLPKTGIYDPVTRARLTSVASTPTVLPRLPSTGNTTPVPTPLPAPSLSASSRLLSLGSKGTDVVALQNALIKKGFLKVSSGFTRGLFGTLTRVAVVRYQVSVGLPQTGVYDALMRARLISDLSR